MSLLRRLASHIAGSAPEWVLPNPIDLLNSMPDGIVIVNAEGRIAAVNSQTEILFGYSRQELIGQAVEVLIPSRFSRAHLKDRASFFAEPRVRPMGRDLDLYGRRKDQTEFSAEISLSPLRTAQGLYVTCAVKRSEEHTSELQSHSDLVCRLLLEKKKYHDLFFYLESFRLWTVLETHPNHFALSVFVFTNWLHSFSMFLILDIQSVLVSGYRNTFP